MKHGILAVAVLLGGAVGLASADYILIKANVGQARGSPGNGPNGPGPGPGGPGGTGVMGMPPGLGQMGGPNPGGTGGPKVGQMGGPMFGQMGNPNPGGTGGPMLGPMGGPMFGQMGGPPGGEGQPVEVLAVVEVEAPSKELQEYAKFEYDPSASPDPRNPSSRPLPPLEAHHHLGRTKEDIVRLLNIKGQNPEVTFEAIPGKTVAKQYEERYKKLFPTKEAKPGAEEIVGLAEWALTHGLNDKFVDLMKKLAEANPTHPVVAAFNQLQADLDNSIKDPPGDLGKDLGQGYTQATLTGGKGHYVLFYSVNNSDSAEVQDRLARLEDSLHTFYYWFALKGPDLVLHRTVHVPEARLPALLALSDDEFRRQHNGFSDPPVVGGAFFARRENLSVYSDRPQDPTYDMLTLASATVWDRPGYNRFDILSGRDRAGYPTGAGPLDRAYVGTLALLTRALEDESARAGVSHDATRQLLFASGLLPRGVTVPEWVQFGMGSFLETPVHSPWPSPAGPNSLYLPIFRDEMSDKGHHFEGDPFQTMKKTVTDGYFRGLKPEDLKKSSPELMRARAATWGLMYFLTQKRLGNLQRYFQLLGEQPRDLELDDAALWECFARAFDAFDPKTKRVDDAKLGNLAAEWQDFVNGVQFDDEALVEKLHKAYENLNKVQEGATPSGPPKVSGPIAP